MELERIKRKITALENKNQERYLKSQKRHIIKNCDIHYICMCICSRVLLKRIDLIENIMRKIKLKFRFAIFNLKNVAIVF